MELVAHEHVVPVLEEAIGVVPGPLVGTAELGAAVQVHLRARAARADQPRLPEVLRSWQLHDALLGHAVLDPDPDRLGVGPQAELLVAAEHGDPDPLRVDPEAVHGELEAPGDRLLLEVVAEAPVAEHLEEGQVAAGVPHLFDVGRAKALLAGREPGAGRLSSPRKYGLKGCMPAIVSRVEVSSGAGISDAEGMRRWPRSSKKDR